MTAPPPAPGDLLQDLRTAQILEELRELRAGQDAMFDALTLLADRLPPAYAQEHAAVLAMAEHMRESSWLLPGMLLGASSRLREALSCLPARAGKELGDPNAPHAARLLGIYYHQRLVNRVYGGWRLEKLAPDGHTKTTLWQMRKV